MKLWTIETDNLVQYLVKFFTVCRITKHDSKHMLDRPRMNVSIGDFR